ncbi:MAG: HEPN domain-containing protein [Deltaproteobacteria bacterium]|nr:HEPN domain-containing protein [Deltaproteobacteria bacterium]
MVGGALKKATQQWIRHSEADFGTAQFLLRARKYLYVGFMCQQAVEKLLKAVICQEMDVTPPRTHNLIALGDLIDARMNDHQRGIMTALTEYYLNNRYPEVKVALARRLTGPVARQVLQGTEAIIQWLREQYRIPSR